MRYMTVTLVVEYPEEADRSMREPDKWDWDVLCDGDRARVIQAWPSEIDEIDRAFDPDDFASGESVSGESPSSLAGPSGAEPSADEEYVARCPACGDPIDYCRGHGEIGDPAGAAVLQRHDEGLHDQCHPDGCEDVPHVSSL